jgi:hypothetical protein
MEQNKSNLNNQNPQHNEVKENHVAFIPVSESLSLKELNDNNRKYWVQGEKNG